MKLVEKCGGGAAALALMLALAACGGAESTAGASAAQASAESEALAVDEAAAGDDGMASALAVKSTNGAESARGFAKGVTGGKGGETVRVTTADQLKYELCRTSAGGLCTDTTSRIIEIASTIDLTDSEGSGSAKGCYATSVCTAPLKSEVTLMFKGDTHCDGKTLVETSYKVAAMRGMKVGSNKTIVGVGSTGAIKGKGFLLQDAMSNIIIRNLSITDIAEGLVFGGDAITIADASRVWIDHNRFARIGRHFIVTGTGDHTGPADNLTISWNEFDGNSDYSATCNGKHYWNLLFYGKGSVTFANNWLHDFSGRAPQINGDTLVHVANNYFEDGSWYALNAKGANTRVLVEGNYFDKVSVPVMKSDAGAIYALLKQTPAAKASCNAALGRACVVNVADPVPTIDNFTQDDVVLTAAQAAASGRIVSPYAAKKVPATVKAGAGVGHID